MLIRPLTVCFQRFQVRGQSKDWWWMKGASISIHNWFYPSAKSTFIWSGFNSNIIFLRPHWSNVIRVSVWFWSEMFTGQDRGAAQSSSSSGNQCSHHWGIVTLLFNSPWNIIKIICHQDFPKRVREHRAVLSRFAKEVSAKIFALLSLVLAAKRGSFSDQTTWPWCQNSFDVG